MTPELITVAILILGFIGTIIGGIWHISRIISKFETSVECLALSVNELKSITSSFDKKVDDKIIHAKQEIFNSIDIREANHKLQHSEERHSFANKVQEVQLDLHQELDKKRDK